MRARENFGRTSAPRLPQAVQTKSGSMSDSLIPGQRSALIVVRVAASVIPTIDQHIADAGCAHFAEDDFLRGGVMSPSRAKLSTALYGRQHVPMFLPAANQQDSRHKCEHNSRTALMYLGFLSLQLPCAGNAGLPPLNLYARVRISLCNLAHETAGAARTRHSLLPLFGERTNEMQNFGQDHAARSRTCVNSAVVLAKARTHYPECLLSCHAVAALPFTTDIGGYRSRRSPG